ncbi:MAG: GH116 family glycosyl hydrolase [Planctomycetota bacterium]|jgi:uncharacterized protein (DUF608 family)
MSLINNETEGTCSCSVCGVGTSRRHFLQVAGLGLVACSSLARPVSVMAGPFDNDEKGIKHFVPADKKLSKEWIDSLFTRGVQEVFRGKELDTIGMPVGGIGAGQLYLCGDGTLGCWQIFGHHHFSGHGRGLYDKYRTPKSPVDQGFAVVVERDGQHKAKRLNKKDFTNVEFVGEYPIGTVRYAEEDFPVKVEMEAFSPFIPLNAQDSGLPATLFHVTVENASDKKLRAGVLGWLENAVCFHTAKWVPANRRNRIVKQKDRTMIVHAAEALSKGKQSKPRPPIVLEDFEGPDYGKWKVEGEAFGTKPAAGTLEGQQKVAGFHGKQLVNTFFGGDNAKGKLTSPIFEINRRFINLLVGGGRHHDNLRVTLFVDGRPVHSTAGARDEHLIWRTWNVMKYQGRKAQIHIVDQKTGSWGHINVDHIELSDECREQDLKFDDLEDNGSMSLGLGSEAASAEQTRRVLSLLSMSPDIYTVENDLVYLNSDKHSSAMMTPYVELGPRAKHTFTFVLGWFFPNRKYADIKRRYPQYGTGQMYTNWFNNASEVAHYVLDNHPRLSGDTRKWRDTYYAGTLPYWLLNRLHSTVSYLATGTCMWWKNGRFWAWEGVGCCGGTCTHVWNYAQASARLFPQLERSVREMQDLGEALLDNGLVSFRGKIFQGRYAADGQCGTVLKCYREHLMSADNNYLKRNWPKIKKVLEYSIEQDANDDGLIENSQHNTFDIEFFGPNTFVGSLYLAALRAGEEMARTMRDIEFAKRVRKIFQSGRKLSVERLWNGEYFIQIVDLNKHPKSQYGKGCISDQLFGQGWARQLGLGNIYPQSQVNKSLQSVWKYNWAPDITAHNQVHKPGRWFISPGEAGLFTCTWPKSPHLDKGVRYKNEVWTGIEYQVAGHMIWDGMLAEGLAIIRAIHDRYHPSKHNPYNEVECGDHYARALASWGCFTALAGYEYNGPKGYLGFSPKISPENFSSAFTAAQGWGLFSQKREGGKQRNRIEVCWGQLTLRTLGLDVPDIGQAPTITIKIAGEAVETRHIYKDGRLTITFPGGATLYQPVALEVIVG